eukprot:CAMPEP_0116999150 /NCGR_PEP_ID=MMETSP0472-20121206/1966_1 /TAXON_ID=693140 ORGANISM="Tiarina fusus, Strain LIS" /NCGR_SAMPLE_ID=MMETSP0472 /ASSEMBLY_ACC=CAM_ASM_000603 /LENGTH=637 /DNA_ID=CAMNT_0004698503 /DNA_START=218 /DNA_END=2131 /DNA_ORIENTATION=-
MSCCCCVGDGDGEQRGSNDAPSKQSMNREMNDDERAVDWWRNRQKSQDDPDDASPARVRSLESSQNRMQERNPLEKPYEIQRELPLTPKDGNILHPSLETAPTVSASPDSVEVFQPEITQKNSNRRYSAETDQCQRLTVVGAVKEEKSVRTKREASGKRRTTASKVAGAALEAEPAPQKRDASGIHRKTSSKKIQKTSYEPAAAKEKNDDERDRLSDVPSDVDSVTKERYLLACHMLKTTLIEKEKAVIPIEREFILSLLGDYDNNADAGSVVSEDQVSAIERAQLRLDKDPLFHVEDEVEDVDPLPPPPAEAASVQMQEKSASPIQTRQLPPPDKKPRALKKPLRNFISNASHACNPRSPEEAGAADIVLIVHEDEQEQDDDDDDIGELVRFDGWSGHKSTEHPFNILGADDPKVHPRVLTPSIMEALRGFFPFNVGESNFWLKFSLNRDGASLATLLSTVRASTYTIIAVETMHGEVFGCFTATPWRTGTKWFGTGEAFLWRLKKSRMTSPKNSRQANFENEMEVYPYTGYDDLVQYCTSKTIAVGGGDWLHAVSPFDNEPRGIGLMIDGDLAGGETNSCATFGNPRLCKKASASNEFSIANLEVWTLTPCMDTKSAQQLEMKKLFVEENMHYEL